MFISYGREEEVREFVKQLKADLEANGVSVWLDANDIPTGSDFHVEWPSSPVEPSYLLGVHAFSLLQG